MPKPKKGKKSGSGGDASHEMDPDWHKAQGNEQFKIANYVGAVECYTRAIELKPTEIVYYSNRSAAYAAIGNLRASQQALEDATKCVELDPTWAKGYYRQGMAFLGLGMLKSAKLALEKGVALAPGEDFSAALESLEKMGVEGVTEADAASETIDAGLVSEEDKFDTLNKWLLDNGAEFPLLYMKRYSENYRGVHIRSTVPRETEIMAIPLACLITVEMGEATDIGQKIAAANLELSAKKHCYLSVFVLVDRMNPDSFFQPYYRILPTSYPNMPIFWNDEQLSWLEGSYMLTQIADRKRNIRADYDDICAVAPDFRRFTLEEFSWARMMVASRNFGIKIGDLKTDALVPLADMLNHYRPRETRWQFDNAKNMFTITSLVRLSAGNQVYDSYGKKCNSRFLLNYGFAVEDNRDADGQCHNEVRIEFRLRDESEDPLRRTKLNLLGTAAGVRGIRVSSWYELESTQEAFSYLRYAWADAAEMMYLPRIYDDSDLGKKPIKPLSRRTEMNVLRDLAARMEAQLKRYPTTLEEDLRVLQDGVFPFGSDRRNALVIIKGEKEVCHFWIKLAELAIPLLSMEYAEARRIISKNFSGSACDIPTAKFMQLVVEEVLKTHRV